MKIHDTYICSVIYYEYENIIFYIYFCFKSRKLNVKVGFRTCNAVFFSMKKVMPLHKYSINTISNSSYLLYAKFVFFIYLWIRTVIDLYSYGAMLLCIEIRISESWSQNVDDSDLTLKMSSYREEKFPIVPDSFAGIEFDRVP